MQHLMRGDCLEKMALIPDGCVDMVLTDPPYGTMRGIGSSKSSGSFEDYRTDWDHTIDTPSMFEACSRVLRPNGCVVLFSQEPYTSHLVRGAIPSVPFSYRYVWEKDHFANALLAKKAPVSYFEDVCVFFKKHTKHDHAGGHPLRDYARRVHEFIGLTKKRSS